MVVADEHREGSSTCYDWTLMAMALGFFVAKEDTLGRIPCQNRWECGFGGVIMKTS